MGAWGPGTFQRDAALDFVGTVIGGLVDRVESLLAVAGSVDGGVEILERYEGQVVPSIEMIAVLCEACAGAPPQPEVVARWREVYLGWWELRIDTLRVRPGYREARRAAIVAAFDRLRGHADRFWSQAGSA